MVSFLNLDTKPLDLLWVSVSILLACEQFNPCCTLGATSLMVSSVNMWGFDCEYTGASAVVVSSAGYDGSVSSASSMGCT